MPETYEGRAEIAPLDKERFDEYRQEMEEADEKVLEAVGNRKELRARIKAAGFLLRSFDRCRKSMQKVEEVVLDEEHQYQQMMAWCGRSVVYTTQTEFDFDGASARDDGDSWPEEEPGRAHGPGVVQFPRQAEDEAPAPRRRGRPPRAAQTDDDAPAPRTRRRRVAEPA